MSALERVIYCLVLPVLYIREVFVILRNASRLIRREHQFIMRKWLWGEAQSVTNRIMEDICKPFVRSVQGKTLPNFYYVPENVMLRFDTEKFLKARMDDRTEKRINKRRAFARNEFESYAKNNRFVKIADLNTDGVI